MRVGRGLACTDWAPGPDLVPDPSSIAGTGGTDNDRNEQVFVNWTDGSGTVLGTNAALRFFMTSDLVLTASH